MVHYIRFLKPPVLDSVRGIVRALVTVTTDLGDYFYPGHLSLFALIVIPEHDCSRALNWKKVQWKSGMRTLWIEVPLMHRSPLECWHLLVNTEPSLLADDISLLSMSEVLSARSDYFSLEKPQANHRIERRYKTNDGAERRVFEETGESIARHIW